MRCNQTPFSSISNVCILSQNLQARSVERTLLHTAAAAFYRASRQTFDALQSFSSMAALSVSKPPTERWEVAKTWRDGGTPILTAPSPIERGVAMQQATLSCCGAVGGASMRVQIVQTLPERRTRVVVPLSCADRHPVLGKPTINNGLPTI